MSDEPRVRQVRGVIRPEDLYSQDGVMEEIGVGRTQLREARIKKLITPYYFGRRAYYKGSEIIALILNGATHER